ncbi:MAG TPA: alpha/beta hydrolase family protein [Actinomycetota bacterium]|nr:alpha/beta hydrolase family protein [Actinomycetota bacterium]
MDQRGIDLPNGPVRRMGRVVASLPIGGLLSAPPKAAKFAVDTWWRGRHPAEDPDEPVVPLTMAMVAQVALDEAVLAVMRKPRTNVSESDYEGVSAELAGAQALYERQGWLDAPRAYHRDPEPLTDPRRTRKWAAGLVHDHLSWPSEYEPYPDEPGRERWLSYEANRTAHARVLSCAEPDRPWLICVHGFGTGWPTADFYAFRVRRLVRDLGLNVILPVLPVHGPRRASRLGGAEFMSTQMQNFVLGMAQAVWDIRRLISWARARGATQIGVYGMSLGAYVASLLSTVEPDLDFVIAGAPVSDLPLLYDTHSPGRIRREIARRGLGVEFAQRAHRVVSPLAAPSLVDWERRYVYAGLGDRMSTPGQARALWEHWDRPKIEWYPGSHMTFIWSAAVARFVDSALVESGFVTPEVVALARKITEPPRPQATTA